MFAGLQKVWGGKYVIAKIYTGKRKGVKNPFKNRWE